MLIDIRWLRFLLTHWHHPSNHTHPGSPQHAQHPQHSSFPAAA